MTNTQVIRCLGRCRLCGHRGAVDAEVRTIRIGAGSFEVPQVAVTGADYERLDPWATTSTQTPAPGWVRIDILPRDAVAARVFKRLGLWCQCGSALRMRPLRAIRDETKRCDDRCKAAVTTACTCSCGGKQHGSSWTVREIGA